MESIETLMPSYEEEEAILERLSGNKEFDDMCSAVCKTLGNKADNTTLLSIATVLLLYNIDHELPGESDWAQALGRALFDKFVQQDCATPRMMILLAANILCRVVTKREYVVSMDKMVGKGYTEENTE